MEVGAAAIRSHQWHALTTLMGGKFGHTRLLILPVPARAHATQILDLGRASRPSTRGVAWYCHGMRQPCDTQS